ncbi:MAG: carbohydrate kinase [Treponema sp. CETP13]|nr:MAG: carbohydrate kinase [Treponema sp. CETP13]
MANIIALGELLIDFIQNDINENRNPSYEANPGGAPCNFLAMAKKFGNKVSFIGKVGNDAFGKQLENAIIDAGINTSGLLKSSDYGTTLAFIHHDSTGDRSFSFYRSADSFIDEKEITENFFDQKDVFHFGTLSMTNDICKKATQKAIKIAQDKNLIISFDPNLRKNLWNNLDKAKEAFIEGFKACDILKIADNELRWFTGIDNIDKAIKVFRTQYPIKLIFVTLGKDGSRAYYKDLEVTAPTFLELPCIDTTGAGDSFFGTAISKTLEYGLNNLDKKNLSKSLIFANAAASIVASRKGVIKSLPEISEIERLSKTNKFY